MTKEEAFKQFCKEIAKEAPQYVDMMRDNCLIVGSFNRGWDICEQQMQRKIDQANEDAELLAYNCEKKARKEIINKACEWLEEHLNDDFTKRVSIEEFRKAMEE